MTWQTVKVPCINWTVETAYDVLDWGKHKVLHLSLILFYQKLYQVMQKYPQDHQQLFIKYNRPLQKNV